MIISSFISCDEEKPFIIPDECSGCLGWGVLNNQDWMGKVRGTNTKTVTGINDTLFSVVTEEINSSSTDLLHVLYLRGIPFDTGKYYIDYLDYKNHIGPIAVYEVYDYEIDYPAQVYYTIYDHTSYISVDSLDKLDNSFLISFDLTLSIKDGENGDLNNSTYPKIFKFSGQVNGFVDFK